MFNVIKGSVINKNVKPVVINPNKKRKEAYPSEEEERKMDSLDEREDIHSEVEQKTTTIKKNEKEYYREYFEDEKEKMDKELLAIKEEIEEKQEELSQLDSRIEQILIEAKTEAERILENARLEAEAETNDIKAHAWEEGFHEGQRMGREEMLSQAEDIYFNANKLLEIASNKRKEILVDAREELVDLAFLIAEKVIKVEVSNKEVLINNIMEAIEKAPKNNEMKIYINIEDFTLAPELKELISKNFRAMNLEIIEDYSLEKGGAIIETKMGRIDASIKGQLEAIYDAIKEV